MLKHIVHSHHGKLHTFDDFYRNDAKTIKTRSPSNELIAPTSHSTVYSSPSPTSPSSPNSNPYTFYNVFSDFKSSNATPDVVLEEDETEQDNELLPQESTDSTPVFYLEDDHHNPSQTSSPSSSSPHWSSLILNRFRHPTHHHHHHHGIVKQNSVNDNQMPSTKIRKNNLSDSSINKHRFLKRSQTINNTNALTEKKSSSDDFPELSLPSKTKHRSFVTLFQHQNKSSSTGTLHSESISNDSPRLKLAKQKVALVSSDVHSPVNKTPGTQIFPKLASLFHRHHFSEHHKHRVGNLKARLHHRRNSPPLTQVIPKFQCEFSNELIQEVQKSEEEEEEQQQQYNAYVLFQRPVKPVVMKRVRTWHNTFDLRPVDQCLEY